ncbi:hypothetical protein CEXT_53131 [Caerostris extrusa]|uniref:Uncharacterized protein n=1 Tax=Caerostris extrusa TaxID=172846 RepID=A0AAV4XZR1_CAEEX|nr:hypothetical protein CEXT_53131 [Caerostris extrusa]
MVQYKPLDDYIGYIYPWWGQTIGWLLGLSSMMCIPVYAAYKYFTTGYIQRAYEEPLQTGYQYPGRNS